VKVAFDHQVFSFQPYGGISRYFFELAHRLPAHGTSEVSVVAPLFVNNYLRSEPASGVVRRGYVPYGPRRVPLIAGVNRCVAPLAWRRVKADIVHETYYCAKPFGQARRRVVTVYDMIHELFAAEFPDGKRVTAAKRAAVDRADHVICISENTRRDLVRLFGVEPARTSVVHLGYPVTAKPDADAMNSRKSRPSLLYVGHRWGYKNFAAVIQAYASSPTLREFELIAFGGPPLQRNERDEISQLGISDRVRFMSGSDQRLAACYESATAFIYPSKYEGFGLSPLEAMSHGCPVVCSNAGSIPEVVGDAGVYFDPNGPDELRTALERVATTESLQADLRARGYARVAAFSWDRCAAETARTYREIL